MYSLNMMMKLYTVVTGEIESNCAIQVYLVSTPTYNVYRVYGTFCLRE